MSTTTLSFKDVITKAKTGSFKLPAFQRKWKWTTKKVMSLYESIRLGYPIGSFLFMTSHDAKRLNPRAFHGTGRIAEKNSEVEALVLDGQQRITAGISIYYGIEDSTAGFEYYISLEKIKALLKEKKINLDDDTAIKTFANSFEVDEGYIIAKPRTNDRLKHFLDSKYIWTPLLTEENQDKLDELLDSIKDKQEVDIIRKVIRKYFKPNMNLQVPIINLDNSFDLGAISRVFTNINTTGKLLTPFELVVAVLYPEDVFLEEKVTDYKSKYLYYKNMETNGEILLQTIALFGNKSPKKSELPKNIDAFLFKEHCDKAVESLNNLGEWLTKDLGLGLDQTNTLIPYDALYAPMGIAFHSISIKRKGTEKAQALMKLKKWFVGASITNRYNEGVHNKQKKDYEDISLWIEDDKKIPTWISDVRISPDIKRASSNGAIGKLLKCLVNHISPKDPVLNGTIGFRDQAYKTEIHHIFPTRWVSKGIKDYEKSFKTDLILNTMFLSQQTNSDWLNFDPVTQINQSKKNVGEKTMYELYKQQFITKELINILAKENKSTNDYNEFIELRYKVISEKLRDLFGFEIVESSSISFEVDDDLSLVEEEVSNYS